MDADLPLAGYSYAIYTGHWTVFQINAHPGGAFNF